MNEPMIWEPIETAPRDGSGFLAFGILGHPVPYGAGRGVQPGDHWWGILVFDIWRLKKRFVFAKDGEAPWSEPLAWAQLRAPPAQLIARHLPENASTEGDA